MWGGRGWLAVGVRGIAVALVAMSLAACAGHAPPAPQSWGERTAGGGAAGSAAAGSGPAGAMSQDPVVLAASQNVVSNVFVWVAAEAGLFAQHGVAVDLQNVNAMNAIKALVAGHLDGVVLGSPQVIAAHAAGTPLTIVAVFVKVYNQVFVVPAQAPSVDWVRGRRVGVITQTSINGVGTIRALRLHGLEPHRDYELLENGAAGTYQALLAQLVARNVDAAALEPGGAERAASEGFKVLFDQATLDLPVASATLAFQADYVRRHPERVQGVVDSLIAGVRYTRERRAETLAALGKYFQITDPTELAQTYERTVHAVLARVPDPAVEQLVDTIEAMARETPGVLAVDPAALIDRRFVDDAVRRGLTSY